MCKIHTFNESLSIGKLGEKHIKNFLEKQDNVLFVKDLSNDKKYQAKGIDFYVETKIPSHGIYLDVKTDTYWTPEKDSSNFFLELESNCNKKKDGCLLTSKANFIFYYFILVGVLYIIPLKKLQLWINQNKDNPIIKKVKAQNKTYSGLGILVNRQVLIDDIKNIKRYSLRN